MNNVVLKVAVNAPLSRLFDYLPPGGGIPPLPGCRVLVPFGRRKLVGLVMETGLGSDLPQAKLRRAYEVLDDTPLFDAPDLRLIRFTSDYYHHPVGEVVAAALPAAMRRGGPLRPVVLEVRLTDAGADLDPAAVTRKAPRQAALLAALQRAGGTASFAALDDTVPGWNRVKQSLEDKGWIRIVERREDEPVAQVANAGESPPELNAGQAAALRAIPLEAGFDVTLLEGVTGSGKTEVYLRLIEQVIARGRQVLALVPEIGLTPQLVARMEKRLGLAPVVLHSSLADTERLAAWRSARDGSAALVLGTRSAVFTPMKHPGLIVVDEEHDSSFKQQEGLRYSARDLALVRAKELGIPVVLGSATPSLESLHHSLEGRYRRLLLPERAGGAAPPKLGLVDLRVQGSEDGLSGPVIAAIERHLAAGSQVLVYINRRGFAPTLICEGCGAVSECRRCDARMTVHATAGRLLCHHCGASRPLDPHCAECGGELTPLGHGTQRLESALRRRFGEHGIARIDSDSTRRKGTMAKLLASAAAGDARVLVGTQMLSKGHHFPDLALVAVVDADQGLFSTDFRGTERLAQSLVQVAGRAGREQRPGEVMIQTAFASHPFWAALLRGGYERVANAALEERRLAGWPPFSRLALLRAAAADKELPQRFLEQAAATAHAIGAADVRVLGPVSAPMERRAGRYRAQLLFQSGNRRMLHRLLSALRPALEEDASGRRVRWSIDVDPIELF